MKFPTRLFRPFNIFTALMVVAVFAFAFRLVNVLSFGMHEIAGKNVSAIGAVMPAGAEETPKSASSAMTSADSAAAATQKPEAAATAMPAAGGSTTPGTAADAAAGADAAKDASKPADASATGAAPAQDEAHDYSSAELEVLQSLSKRRDDLDKREKKLGEREALLAAAEQEVDHKIGELNKLKDEIEGLLGKQQKMEEDRLASLVKIYEGMKPKEAATIFNTLDLDVLLAVIGRMNERKSGPILASMDPDKARIVTIKLAEQRKLPNAPPADSAAKP
ncbi:MAG: MotE family protein [Micavibrio sp.]|nr:MotE family protein [Micavibrio sp.]